MNRKRDGNGLHGWIRYVLNKRKNVFLSVLAILYGVLIILDKSVLGSNNVMSIKTETICYDTQLFLQLFFWIFAFLFYYPLEQKNLQEVCLSYSWWRLERIHPRLTLIYLVCFLPYLVGLWLFIEQPLKYMVVIIIFSLITGSSLWYSFKRLFSSSFIATVIMIVYFFMNVTLRLDSYCGWLIQPNIEFADRRTYICWSVIILCSIFVTVIRRKWPENFN